MGLSCGLVGLPSCGKTVVVKAITAAGASSYDSSEMSKVVVNIPDQRINKLVDMYHPQKSVYHESGLISVGQVTIIKKATSENWATRTH